MFGHQYAHIDRAREQLWAVLDATTAVIYMKDAVGRYLFVNRQFQEVFGLRREQVIGKLDEEVLPALAARTLREDDLQSLSAGAPRELEEIIETGDGATHTYLSLKLPILDPGGAPCAICCVATDITQRKRADETLQREREAAERARRLKQGVEARDQFLAITAHELRTPLTCLELQVESLRRLAASHPGAAVADGRFQSKCQAIMKQVDRLTVLIDGLIDIGRMTSGALEPSRESIDLGDLARSVIARTHEAVQRTGSGIILKVDAPVVGAWDRSLLERAIGHLLSNAVKFGNGNPIELSIDATPGHATLTVRDRGIGISLQDQERIFDRFERAVSGRNFGGFGIGLWVVRQAVEAHGGTIRVRSELGAGSEFTIELPLRARCLERATAGATLLDPGTKIGAACPDGCGATSGPSGHVSAPTELLDDTQEPGASSR